MEEGRSTVWFVCQFCHQPLGLDPDLLAIDTHGLAALTARDEGRPEAQYVSSEEESEGENSKQQATDGSVDEGQQPTASEDTQRDLPTPEHDVAAEGGQRGGRVETTTAEGVVRATISGRKRRGQHRPLPAGCVSASASGTYAHTQALLTAGQGAGSDSIKDSFVVLASNAASPRTADNINRQSLSHRIKVVHRLFDIMAGDSDIDHPLCADCTDQLLVELEGQVDEAEAEERHYRGLAEARAGAQLQGPDQAQAAAELSQLELEEQQLVFELRALERQRAAVQETVARLRHEERALQHDEDMHWKAVNEFCRQYDEYLADRESMDLRYAHASEQLEKLKRTNILNDTFHIWFTGPFGTINNFRMGRLPDVPVEWSEINAAWGQAALLLHTLAARLKFTFARFRPVAKGSQSYMEKLDTQQALELWMTGGLHVFQSARYDQAMAAFLACLQQLTEHLERRDPIVKLPYSISKDTIDQCSIRRGMGSTDAEWTRACRALLTNLKWAMTWAHKVMQRD